MRHVAGLLVQKHNFTLLVFKKGSWFFPGGKREGEETLEETVRRELMEELKMSISGYPTLLHEGVFDAPFGESFCFHTFTCSPDMLCGHPILDPNDSITEFAWVDEPLGLNLTPHARFILERFSQCAERAA